MSEAEKDDGADEVDGLLESLTNEDGYRTEQETLPFDVETMAPPPARPAAPPPTPAGPPPAPSAEKPRMPLPAAGRVPRPGDGTPAIPPAARRDPKTTPRPPPAGRPVPRPTKGLPGGTGLDDAEIDAALMSLSISPPGPTSPPMETPGVSSMPATRPGQPATFTDPSSLAPNPDSWLPPQFDESLDDLEAVEVDDETADHDTSLRLGPNLAELAAGLSTGPKDAIVEVEAGPDLEALDAELDDWDEERTTSVPDPRGISSSRSPKTTAPAARVEMVTGSLDDLGVSHDDDDVDALLGLAEPEVARLGDTTPAPASAVAQLGGHHLIDAWVARAEWFEAEAQATGDPQARARLLLAASELWAMSGSLGRSRNTASRASTAWPSLSLASRQARALAALDGDFNNVAAALDVESRSASTEAARAHAMYLAAEVHRITLDDTEGAKRRLEALAQTAPDDPRPHLAQLAVELGRTRGAPKTPPSNDARLSAAHAELSRLRSTQATQGSRSAMVAFKDATRAIFDGDRAVAGGATKRLGDVPGIGDGALLLAAAFYSPDPDTRPEAIAVLRTLLERAESNVVRRALAARALEHGDREAMDLALLEKPSDDPAFAPSDRVALGALTGADSAALSAAAETIAGDESLRPLAAAAASASAIGAAGLPVGDPATFARIALGRKLATVGSVEELKDAVHAVRAALPDAEIGRVLALELDAAAGATTAAATELARLAPEGMGPDGKLAAALIEEVTGRADAARRNYTSALASPDRAEAAARAIAATPGQSVADLLSMLSLSLGEETTARQALLLYEAAVRTGLGEAAAEDLLARAYDAFPTLPFASRAAIDQARTQGEAGKLLEWLRKQQNTATDPTLRALVAVREALLVADDDPTAAAVSLSIAITARPDDVALRELEGRLSTVPSVERGRWRERAAENAPLGRTQAWFSFEAAHEYERAGALEDAERAGLAAAAHEESPLAQVIARRRTAEPLEAADDGLRASRAAEQQALGGDADEVLEAIATKLVDLPDRGEAVAHARLAVRLRIKSQDWDTTRELLERAYKHKPASLWTLRQVSAHARLAEDRERVFEVDKELSDRAERSLDRATLALRAAEAAAHVGKTDEALELLGRTIDAAPEHLVALDLRAAITERVGRFAEAAEDLETLAAAALIPEHQCDAWYRAATLWSDKLDNAGRSVMALERVASLDITKADAFERLQREYIKLGDRAKLAELLETRLSKTTAPEERIALEVTRGRALADVGDRDAARRALGAALDANPDHADALEAYGTLALAEGEWKRAEDTWIRLARVATSPEKQAEVYGRLATLYDSELPNPQRAEICYREILKRLPNDPAATSALVRVYGRLGDVVKAVQLQTELVDKATDPDEKRRRTLALAEVYDEVAKDKRSALAILEKARKAWPHDPAVLRAMARHHERHGETAAENVLLDRAAAEARRALSHGRFDLAFFGVLETVSDLRGQADAASVASATLAALEGKNEVAVRGAGAAGSAQSLDDLTAPELLGSAMRSLLEKLPGVLDSAYPVDLKALRASPLPPSAADLGGEIRAVAESMGTRSLELLVSPLLGPVFLAASCSPARLVMGQSLLETSDDAVRYFLLVRAIKIIQAGAAALSRIPPIELSSVIGAVLSVLAQGFQPTGVDAAKLADARRRIEPALAKNQDPDLPTLALEIGGTIGNRASQLGQAVAQWGSRTALLAVGSPALALRGVAFALGLAEGVPGELGERLKWVQRSPEARDLCVFSVSENYAEARRRVGLAV